MKDWQIVGLLALGAIVIVVLLRHHKNTLALATASKPTGNNTIGGQLARSVPIYGTAIKAASLIEKPVIGVLDKVNSTVSSGLKHIPIIGGIAASVNTGIGGAVDSVLHGIGF